MLDRFMGRFRQPRGLYDGRATLDDIAACFRLLLGRAPNPEEWRGHAMRAGEDLAGVVASYVNSLEFSRRCLLDQDHLRHVTLASLPDFSIYAADSDAAVGRYVRENNYEPEVTEVFRRVLRRGMGVLDIGANIGYFTMLSASLVGDEGYVLAVEPNAGNVRLLEASRRANGFFHVQVAQTAAGEQTGLLVLHRSHSNGTTSLLPDDLNALLGAETVGCVAVEALLKPERRIDLIKVDVEGAEYKALLGCQTIMAQHRPVIISEFSPNLMPGISGIDGRGYLEWLIGRNYQLAVIEPDGGQSDILDPETVMAIHARRGTDHVDIVCTPT